MALLAMLLHRYRLHQPTALFRLVTTAAFQHGASALRIAHTRGVALTIWIAYAFGIHVQFMVELEVGMLDQLRRILFALAHAAN
jgi:hypothetical protein